MTVLSVTQSTYQAALAHLSERPEQVGFFLADWDAAQGKFSVRLWNPLGPTDLEYRSDFHVSLKDHVRPSIIKWAWDNNGCLVEAHSHGELGSAMFSPSDLNGFEEWVPHVRWRLGGRPYAAIVSGGESFDGLVWIESPGNCGQLDRIEVLGEQLIAATGQTMNGRGHESWSDLNDE